MSKATAKLTTARGDFTYEQVAAASGLTADQVRRTELAPAGVIGFWLLTLCDVYGLGFSAMAALIEADTREITGLPTMASGPLQAEQVAEQSAMEFL